MTRSVDLGVPAWLSRFLVAGFAVFVLLWGGLAVSQVFVGRIDLLERGGLVASLAGLWLLLTVAWVRWARRQESGGSVWQAVPRSQYLGRFAEAGGLTRRDQERALPDDEDR